MRTEKRRPFKVKVSTKLHVWSKKELNIIFGQSLDTVWELSPNNNNKYHCTTIRPFFLLESLILFQ